MILKRVQKKKNKYMQNRCDFNYRYKVFYTVFDLRWFWKNINFTVYSLNTDLQI